MQFNNDQNQASLEIKRFIGSQNKYYLLEGAAGTGKTTIIAHILANSFAHKNIIFSAPTHKALSVLRSKLELNKTLKSKFMTVHKLLGLRRKIDDKGAIYFNDVDEDFINNEDFSNISKCNIIIIDEASMISNSIYQTIMTKFANNRFIKIIFVGDRNQLPPVNEQMSVVFKRNIPSFKLNKIERYKNGIVKYANSIIENTKVSKKQLMPEVEFIKQEKDWIESYLDNYESSIILAYTNNRVNYLNRVIRNKLIGQTDEKYVENDKIVFNNYYANETTSFYTSQIEIIETVEVTTTPIKVFPITQILNLKYISNGTSKLIEKTKLESACPCCYEEEIDNYYETVCGHKFCTTCLKIWLENNKTCPMCRCEIKGTNEVVIKNDAKLSNLINLFYKKTVDKDVDTYRIKLRLSGMGNSPEIHTNPYIFTIHQDSKETYDEYSQELFNLLIDIRSHILKKSKDKFNKLLLCNLWNYYYNEIIDNFANIVYGYAMTVHKSQGSTYENVYVDLNNIMINKNEKKECVYTGITRSSKNLKILI